MSTVKASFILGANMDLQYQTKDKPSQLPSAKHAGPKKLEEARTLAQVLNLLNFHRMRGNLVFRRIHVGAKLRNTPRGVVFCKNEMVGMPDLLVWLKNGPCIGLEIKSPNGKQSQFQKQFEQEMLAMGQHYFVIKSLDEVVLVLKSYNVNQPI